MKLALNIIIGLLLASAVFFGAQYFLGDKPAPATTGVQVTRTPGSTVRPLGTSAERISNDDFVALLKTANTISFSSEIFDDPVFLQLEDFHQPLPDRAVGRVNPFATFGSDGRSATSTAPNRSNR